MASSLQYVKLAQALPPRLMRFFARYPPPALQSTSHSSTPVNSSSATAGIVPIPTSDNASATSNDGLETDSVVGDALNPFRSQRHPATGNWHDPIFSLRRQADLVKLARQHGVEGLLPFTVKGTEERIRRREENGLRVKGTGVGQKVKGKAWERTLKGRLEKRRQAMLEMPKMIQTWKEVSTLNMRGLFVWIVLTFLCRGAMVVVGRSFPSDTGVYHENLICITLNWTELRAFDGVSITETVQNCRIGVHSGRICEALLHCELSITQATVRENTATLLSCQSHM